MVCARRTGVGRVPWLGGPGRRELAFNGIFQPPKVRARRAPRLALPGRCERLTMRSLSGAARPAHPVGWPWQSSFSRPAPECSAFRAGTSGGPDNASVRAHVVRSRPPNPKSAPNRPIHTALTVCRVPPARSFDEFAALCGRGGRRRGWRRSRRCGRRPPGARGTARGRWGGRASALRALHARAHYGRPCVRVGAWAPGGLRDPVAPSAGAGSARGCPRGVAGPVRASGKAPGSARRRPPVRVGSFRASAGYLGVSHARVTSRVSTK
jgi:hypothetical protein